MARPHRAHLGALLAALVLAGCGGDEHRGAVDVGDTSHLTDTPLPPLPATRPVDLPTGHRIRFRATDGVLLTGTLYAAAERHAPAVVLVHGLAGGPRQWDALVRALHDAGLAALTYGSRSAEETDAAVLARDVTGAVRALRRRAAADPDRIALAGGSVGGAAVAEVLATRLPVACGVALSPVGARDARPHDLLVLSDPREHPEVRGPGVTREVAPTVGHGSALLRSAAVRDRTVAWLAHCANLPS